MRIGRFKVAADLSALRRTRWYEYALRLVLGGLATIATGLIADRFGATVGGLFLAFPVILPAAATLLEKHERRRKRNAGIESTMRGRQAAGVDAAGAALGALGLCVFALVVWRLLEKHRAALVLLSATAAWLTVAALLWWLRKRHAWRLATDRSGAASGR